MDKIEIVILKNLINNEEYLRKVIPFIKSEYFEDSSQKVVFEEISSFVQEYNKVATKEILSIEIEKRTDITQEELVNINKTIKDGYKVIT